MNPLPTHEEFWDRYAPREDTREERSPFKKVHTDICWREIDRHLEGVKTVLDVGAGSGRFSLPLARRGFEVVHFDISSEMIKVAQKKAETEKLSSIRFIQGTVTDLTGFHEDEFDLVLCLDAPVSFVYPQHIDAQEELTRVTRKTLIISVSSRTGNLPTWVQGDVLIAGKWLTAWRVWREGIFEANEEILALQSPLIPKMYFFRLEEIRSILVSFGMQVERLCAPGGLARQLPREAMEKLVNMPEMYSEFLTLEEEYDVDVPTVGIDTAGNLLITALKGKKV